MILNTGNRTDIPAFFSDWFYNRIKAGFVQVRNPYVPHQIIEYKLDPDVVDVICFCTKNPAPMFKRLHELAPYRQYWMMTITPYGKEIEPHIYNKRGIMKSFRYLSNQLGTKCVDWRYDPIFLNQKYTVEFHIRAFEQMARYLCGYTHRVIISFVDLYQKTSRNFPDVKEVEQETQLYLAEKFVEIGKKYDMHVVSCLEGAFLASAGVDISGCMTQSVLEYALDVHFALPNHGAARKGCACLLNNDIGAYNTCGHGCKYCYANDNMDLVYQNQKRHDPHSPLLVGHAHTNDTIVYAKQKSVIERQLRLF